MTRAISRRLERLEASAAAVAARQTREPHILHFVNPDRIVTSTFNMGTGVWTHFRDEPRIALANTPSE